MSIKCVPGSSRCHRNNNTNNFAAFLVHNYKPVKPHINFQHLGLSICFFGQEVCLGPLPE